MSTASAVPVPSALLLNRELPPIAKLIWMASRLPADAGTPRAAASVICGATGLSRPAVLKGLAQLAAAGWAVTAPTPPGHAVRVPAEVLTNPQIGIKARVLYGTLLLTPGFSHPSGYVRWAELGALASIDAKTAARALAELVGAEWITLERPNRLARIRFELSFPGLAAELTEVARAQWRLGQRGHVGETLMREYLSLLIDRTDFIDNGYPGFLENPGTEGLLQFDRFYPPSVAFEFNGPQHDHPTPRFSTETVAQQRQRDLIKMGLCIEQGITLVILRPEDLTLERMRQKVAQVRPVRDVAGHELLIDLLERESATYRRFSATLR